MGKVGHPAGLPATSYSTALVFLDQFAQGTGVNINVSEIIISRMVLYLQENVIVCVINFFIIIR